MELSRTKNAKLNIIYGYIAQLLILCLSFWGRKIFLQFLSIEYLGINGLFSNILIVLSLAELGLDTAVTYSFYGPVVKQDKPLIKSLLNYFKKLYWGIAALIFIAGLVLIPFMGNLVKTDLSNTEVITYYVLFLIDTVLSYLGAHYVALLAAYQEQRVQKLVQLMVNVALQILHILVLIIFRNYYAYVIVNIVGTLANCLLLGAASKKRHRDIYSIKEEVEINKREILNRIKSAFLYKVGGVLVGNTDNILISVMVGISAVGLYSNYLTVVMAVQGLIATAAQFLISGIGNLCASASDKKKNDFFQVVLLAFNIFSFIGFIGFYLLFNELITFWIGTEYLLDSKVVFMIAFGFLVNNIITPVWMYLEANGLFHEVRYLLLITAGINIVLSFILGNYFGLAGILWATSISRIVTSVWYEPLILYQKVFNASIIEYWKVVSKNCLLGLIAFIGSFIVIKWIPCYIFLLPIKAFVICIIVCIVFFAGCHRSEAGKSLMQYICPTRKKIINKI